MTFRATGWLRALVFTGTLTAMGCGDDGPPSSPVTCTPTCSAGYTCVTGACVAVCAPACEGGQSCVVTAGVASCSGGDAGSDVVVSQDATPDAAKDVVTVDATPDATSDAAPDATVGPDVTSDVAPDVVTPPTCTPACSAGYTCVAGACVALCNPMCGAGETCTVRDGVTVCLRITVDAGSDVADVPATMDVPAGDRPAPTDAPVGMDAPPTMDAPAMDVPADTAPAPCGMTAQPCCGFDPTIPSSVGSCRGANVCDRTTRRCVAYTLESNECTTTGECPAGQVCGLGDFCSSNTRSCLRCTARVGMGALAAGMPCGGAITAPCADGLCANGRCTRACVPGAAGDAVCQGFRAGTVCAELQQSVRLEAGTSNPVTFGACIRACRRDMDCADPTGNLRCGLSVRRLDDSLLQTCRVAFGTIAAGANCPLNPTSGSDPMMYCQSGQCFSVPTSMTTGFCSAFCATDADCPASAPACRDIPFFRPSGTGAPTQPIRMCERR
jgi:hypothetical protein